MTNGEKGLLIADQCMPCSFDFYSGIQQGVKLALDAEQKNLDKAKKWDELEEKIARFYFDKNGEIIDDEAAGDLVDIGEVAAAAFGFLS